MQDHIILRRLTQCRYEDILFVIYGEYSGDQREACIDKGGTRWNKQVLRSVEEKKRAVNAGNEWDD
jgi:hypothetical protein